VTSRPRREWSFEVKWDGVRTLAAIDGETIKLHSRRGRDVTEVYPELGSLPSLLVGKNALLDGELVVMGDNGVPSFERIQRRFTTDKPSKRELARDPVQFLVFDLLWFDGESQVQRTYIERRGLLERVLVQGDSVQISDRFPGDRGTVLFKAVSERGMEGLIAKRLDSVYLPGKRTKDWMKVKVRRSIDAVVIGWSPGAGSRDGAVGSLLVAIPDDDGTLRFAGHVGTGFTKRTAEALVRALEPQTIDAPSVSIPEDAPIDVSTRWVAPSLVVAVEYLELTSQHRLRAASFKGVLADRSPEDLEREI
jgi:bifunctional non-homologous end joining protein LigD